MSGLFLGADDAAAEGPATTFAGISRLGVDRVVLALAYHRARDLTPHSPARVTLRRDGVHFRPADDLFGTGSLRPPEAGPPVAAEVIATARAAGLGVDGWAVFCHNMTLGLAATEVTQLNCFGGRAAPSDLCPAHPRVRRYCVDLATGVARLGVDAVVAESLHFGTFGHGYHHERSSVPLGGVGEFLLGCCFCPSCSIAAADHGADPAAVAAAARGYLEPILAGERAPSDRALTPATLTELHPHFGAWLAARADTVTTLVAAVAAATAAAGSRLVFVDITGAMLGYADGHPDGPLATDTAWVCGVDPAQVSQHSDGYAVLAYADSAQRITDDLRAYRAAIGPRAELRAVLRPYPPDTTSPAQLRERAAAAREAGADDLDFYHYALATRTDLERLPV